MHRDGEILQEKVEVCLGLYKIFDEILVNAVDNYQRDRKMNKIEVEISCS